MEKRRHNKIFERPLRTESSEKENLADEIMSLLKDSPTLEALKSERRAKINAERRGALQRIARVEQERSQTLPVLYQSFKAAKLRVEELEAEFKTDMAAACRERDRLDYEHACARFRIDNSLSKDRRLLLDTAAPELDELYRWLLAEDEKARSKISVKLGIKRDVVGVSSLVMSNAAAISRRRAAIKAVMTRIDELRFEIVEDVAGEIATLKASIPPEGYSDEEIEERLPPLPRDEAPRYTDDAKDRHKIHVPDISWFI
jgi:hypothetical protein